MFYFTRTFSKWKDWCLTQIKKEELGSNQRMTHRIHCPLWTHKSRLLLGAGGVQREGTHRTHRLHSPCWTPCAGAGAGLRGCELHPRTEEKHLLVLTFSYKSISLETQNLLQVAMEKSHLKRQLANFQTNPLRGVDNDVNL